MLTKLFKYDFRGIGRMLFPFTLLVIAVAAVGCGAMIGTKFLSDLSIESTASLALGTALVMIAGAAALGVIAYAVLAFIAIFARFYKNFFTDEGYLTFTLPVKTHQLMFSKLFSTIIWALISGTVTLSLSFLMIGTASTPKEKLFTGELFASAAEFIKVVFNGAEPKMVIPTLICFAAQGLCTLCMVFLAITLGGNIARRAKVFASVGFYFALSSAVQTVMVVATVVVSTVAAKASFGRLLLDGMQAGDCYALLLSSIAAVYAAVAVVEFIITNAILKKHLNLA